MKNAEKIRERFTNNDVAETALRSDVFALQSSCEDVTSRKFVRFVGSALHNEAPATTRKPNAENRITKIFKMLFRKKGLKCLELETICRPRTILETLRGRPSARRAPRLYTCNTHPGTEATTTDVRCHKCYHTYRPTHSRSFSHPIGTARTLADL